ncbi:MAG: hypothetical protein Rubg2KO_00530 [Rubricoccaceae bacterium]
MRISLLSFLLVALVLPVSGCGGFGLFGKSDLTALEVSGRYQFTEYTMEPTSGAVRDVNLLRDVMGDNVVLNLELGGIATLERVGENSVEETLSTGTYEITGRNVRVNFDDGGRLSSFYMPGTIVFEGGGDKLNAEVFQPGVNLEDINDDYQGVTSADVQLKIGLRKI